MKDFLQFALNLLFNNELATLKPCKEKNNFVEIFSTS